MATLLFLFSAIWHDCGCSLEITLQEKRPSPFYFNCWPPGESRCVRTPRCQHAFPRSTHAQSHASLLFFALLPVSVTSNSRRCSTPPYAAGGHCAWSSCST